MTRERLVGGTVLLACAFPYLQVVFATGGASYTQPFPLIAGLASYFLVKDQFQSVLPADRVPLFVLAALGLVLFLFTAVPSTEVQEYKYLLIYMTPLLLVPGIATFIRRQPEIATRLLAGAIGVWIAVALVQTVYHPAFATSLLGEWGNYAENIVRSGRGVLGLAPEPTHHAFQILILAAALLLLDKDRKWRWVVVAAVVDALVLAASSSAALAVGLATVVLFLVRRPVTGVVIFVVLRYVWPYLPAGVALVLGSDSRLTQLATAFVADPAKGAVADYSVNIRLGGVYATFANVFEHWLMPRGLAWSTWMATRAEALRAHPWILDLSTSGPASGIGVLLFQAGFLVIAPLVAMFRRILQLPGRNMFEQVLLLSMPAVFLSQYYLSAPAFAVLYACATCHNVADHDAS